MNKSIGETLRRCFFSEVMSRKRSAEDVAPVQRTRIKLASPSPERTSASDTESIHSCQGYKTEVADDTSDTSSPATAPNIEYEVINAEVKKPDFICSEESSEEDFQNYSDQLFATSNDDVDIALFGDTSEEISTSPTSNSDVDPGLPRNDYLDFEKCLLCKTDKKDISYPYCSSCFSWRKNLFPSRPKRRKKAIRANISELESVTTSSSTSGFQSGTSENASQEKKSVNSNFSDAALEGSGMESSNPQLSEDVVDGPMQPSTSSSQSTSGSIKFEESEACRVCFAKRENGLFVHASSAHLYGCYNCAKEIWYHNGGCPICRRKVYKVTKLYV